MKMTFEISERELQAILAHDHLGTAVARYDGPTVMHGPGRDYYAYTGRNNTDNFYSSKRNEKLRKKALKVERHGGIDKASAVCEQALTNITEEISSLRFEKGQLEAVQNAARAAGREDLVNKYDKEIFAINAKIRELEYGL